MVASGALQMALWSGSAPFWTSLCGEVLSGPSGGTPRTARIGVSLPAQFPEPFLYPRSVLAAQPTAVSGLF